MNNAKRQPAPTAAAGQKAIHQAVERGASLPPQYAKAILNSYFYALEVGRDGRNDYEQEALATAAALKQMLLDHGIFTN